MNVCAFECPLLGTLRVLNAIATKYSHFLSVAVIDIMIKATWERKGFIAAYTSRAQSAHHSGKSGQELKRELNIGVRNVVYRLALWLCSASS